MRPVVWLFLFCLAGIAIGSVVLSGELAIVNTLYVEPFGAHQVTSNLIAPLETLILLFVIGAIVSAFIWLRTSNQS